MARLLRATLPLDRTFERLAAKRAQGRLAFSQRILLRLNQAIRNLRSDYVLARASDDVLLAYNELLYSGLNDYVPGEEDLPDKLFPWEEEAIAAYFPKPPARVLVGAAGSGREAFQLARMGYEVVAFEPVEKYVAAMLNNCSNEQQIRVCQASYEDLPWLVDRSKDGARVRIDSLGSFDASIIGWQSFSIIRSEETRRRTIEIFVNCTQGPVLMSYACLRERPSRLARSSNARSLARWILSGGRRLQWNDGDYFTARLGFRHRVSDSEIEDLANRANAQLVHRAEPSNEFGGFHTTFAILKSKTERIPQSS